MARSDAVLDRLTRLHPKLIDLSLGRIERLLAALGHPEEKLAPVVHIAGTNGKGSVLAFLRAMLEAAGQRVQLYTSPHLVRFHERIRLTGGPIAEPDLAALLETCEAANGAAPITFFEITTAAAFLAFAREPADILLLETGLGGRLDATNLIARPRLTAISPISVDHVQFLGETIEEIAFEKAGILKPGVPAVIGPQAPEARAVIARRAAELGAPLHRHGMEWRVGAEGSGGGGGFFFEFGGARRRYPAPVLRGTHQIENAGLAVAALRALDGFEITPEHLADGLLSAVWPARLQRLSRGPLAARLPEGWEIWIDAGHNPSAGQAVAQTAAAEWGDKPLHLIAAMLNSKDPVAYFEPLAAVAHDARCVAMAGEAASLSADEMTQAAGRAGIAAKAAASVDDALDDILRTADKPARILICGSHYLVGALLVENG